MRWTNWVGNQSCTPRRVEVPLDEEEVRRIVARATREGLTARVAGAGHSFTPVVCTDGVLLDLAAMTGVTAIDAEAKRVSALAGTRIRRSAIRSGARACRS